MLFKAKFKAVNAEKIIDDYGVDFDVNDIESSEAFRCMLDCDINLTGDMIIHLPNGKSYFCEQDLFYALFEKED